MKLDYCVLNNPLYNKIKHKVILTKEMQDDIINYIYSSALLKFFIEISMEV